MNYKTKFTEEIKIKLLNEFSVKGPTKIAKELNVDSKTIYNWRKKLGLKDIIQKKTKLIELTCPECNNKFCRTEGYIKHYTEVRKTKKLTCSKKCAATRKESNSLSTKAFNLALEGYTNKEISQLMDRPMGTIASWLNRKKYRKYKEGGQSYSAIRKRLLKRPDYQKCTCCEFNRIIEVAHIIPASKGGNLTYENTLPLCPNHHHLFDHNRLNSDENILINIAIKERSCAV